VARTKVEKARIDRTSSHSSQAALRQTRREQEVERTQTRGGARGGAPVNTLTAVRSLLGEYDMYLDQPQTARARPTLTRDRDRDTAPFPPASLRTMPMSARGRPRTQGGSGTGLISEVSRMLQTSVQQIPLAGVSRTTSTPAAARHVRGSPRLAQTARGRARGASEDRGLHRSHSMTSEGSAKGMYQRDRLHSSSQLSGGVGGDLAYSATDSHLHSSIRPRPGTRGHMEGESVLASPQQSRQNLY
ncbi:hypothetical protein KIPB_011888, partial [Kipferlia bialata]